MNDGDRHDRPKLALQRALSSLPAPLVNSRAAATAGQLLPATLDAEALTAWVYETPIVVVADLIGFPADERSEVARDVRDFVACFSALSTPEQLENASTAVQRLRSRLSDTLDSLQPKSDNLASRILANAQSLGWVDRDALIANLVGLLSQTYEATAGLIGNSIVTLASHQGLWDEVRSRVDGWQQLVLETSRYEAPVQNTRRFVVETTIIADTDIEAGATILLVLAAANRDPRVNAEPTRFLLDRPNRCTFTFSRGAHACPGEEIARRIAASALSVLDKQLDSPDLAQLAWTWKPSPNGRLPLFRDDNTTRTA
jgi:cytochrome P450